MQHSTLAFIRGAFAVASVTAGCLLLAGCPGSSSLTVHAAPAPETAPAPSSVPPPARSILPIPESNIDTAIARLPDLVKTVMANTGIPGVAVAVVHNGKKVYAQGFGVRKEGESARITADTVFQLASLSKPVSATIVAATIGDCAANNSGCAVTWDTPIQTYLPTFSLSDPYVSRHVTIGDMFSHRSGLPDHAGDTLMVLGFDRQQILSRMSLLPLDPFRISYAYTNFGLSAAAFSVAHAKGLDWASLAQQELFVPLGMNATSYRYNDYLNRSNRAALHVKRDGRWQALYTVDDDDAAPAGGLSASVNDMAHWMELVLADGKHDGNQMIAPQNLLPALSPQNISAPPNTPSTRAGFYGYGFNINYGLSGRVQLGHSGAFSEGAGTNFELIPSANVGIIVLTNAEPIGAAETIASQFSDIVQYGSIRTDWPGLYGPLFAAMIGPAGDLVGEERPTDPVPPKPNNAYIGTYHSNYFGKATVSVEDGQLVLKLGPKPLAFTLHPWNGDEFAIDPVGPVFSPGSASSVWFKVNSSGVASQLTVTMFNNETTESDKPADAFSPYLRASAP